MKKEQLHTKNPGFKIPEDYLHKLEDALFEKLAEKPATLPEKEAFSVPANYFKEFEPTLYKKLQPAPKGKIIPFARYKKIYYAASAVAAAVALFFLLENRIPASATVNTITIADVERYIDNGYISLQEYDLAKVFDAEDFAEITLTTTKIEDEALIDYLSENIDPYHDLSLEN